MLRWRLILGSLFVAVLAGLCWLDARASLPGVYLLPLAVVAGWFIAGELLAMLRQSGRTPAKWSVYAGTLVTILASAAPMLWAHDPIAALNGRVGWLALGLAAGWLLLAVAEIFRYQEPGDATVNLASALLVVFYAGGLIGFLVQLRLVGGGPWDSSAHWGMLALVSLIVTVKMSDIGQYTVGRLLGNHKLAPRISPGKTWEGAGGGFAFALVAATLVFWIGGRWALGAESSESLPLGRALRHGLVYALALTPAGIVGDLTASLLKRDAGVKDSSSWMPGFGGVVDLVDSLLAAAPVGYLLWALGVVGG